MRKNNTLFISETGRVYKKIPSSLPQKLRNDLEIANFQFYQMNSKLKNHASGSIFYADGLLKLHATEPLFDHTS
jgi:hypothetical protein